MAAPTTTILRLKRKRNEPAPDSILISCKRKKGSLSDPVDDKSQTPINEVIRLVGTVDNKEDSNIYNLPKAKDFSAVKNVIHQNSSKISGKRTCQLNSNSASSTNEGMAQPMLVYDISQTPLDQNEAITCNGEVMAVQTNPKIGAENMSIDQLPDEEDKYVYDIFYAQSDVLSHTDFEDLCIEAYNEDYGFMRSAANVCIGDSCEEDEDDSNDELNWRNDYPDDEACGYGSSEDCDEEPGYEEAKGSARLQEIFGHKCQLASIEDDDELGEDCDEVYRAYKRRKQKEFKLTDSTDDDSDEFR